ncbi:unnamed protein product [Prunus armeniaca]
MYGPKAAYTMTQEKANSHAPSANLWIIYTGAYDHMTCDTNMFNDLSRNPRDYYITSTNGLPSPVTDEGSHNSLDDRAW